MPFVSTIRNDSLCCLRPYLDTLFCWRFDHFKIDCFQFLVWYAIVIWNLLCQSDVFLCFVLFQYLHFVNWFLARNILIFADEDSRVLDWFPWCKFSLRMPCGLWFCFCCSWSHRASHVSCSAAIWELGATSLVFSEGRTALEGLMRIHLSRKHPLKCILLLRLIHVQHICSWAILSLGERAIRALIIGMMICNIQMMAKLSKSFESTWPSEHIWRIYPVFTTLWSPQFCVLSHERVSSPYAVVSYRAIFHILSWGRYRILSKSRHICLSHAHTTLLTKFRAPIFFKSSQRLVMLQTGSLIVISSWARIQ